MSASGMEEHSAEFTGAVGSPRTAGPAARGRGSALEDELAPSSTRGPRSRSPALGPLVEVPGIGRGVRTALPGGDAPRRPRSTGAPHGLVEPAEEDVDGPVLHVDPQELLGVAEHLHVEAVHEEPPETG